MKFHPVPTNSISCVLDTNEQVDSALVDLAKAGFHAGKVLVLHGEMGRRWLDASGAYHGRWARFVRVVQRACSEGEESFLNQTQNALEADRYILIVETDGTTTQRETIRDIARRFSTDTLFYCGTFAIEEL